MQLIALRNQIGYNVLLKTKFTNTLLLGDSIIAGLLRYFRVCQIFYPIKSINFRNWERLSRKNGQVSHESINTFIAEKCGYIMWKQPSFHIFSYEYSWLYYQYWLLLSWTIQQYQRFHLRIDLTRWKLVRK